MPKHIFYLLSAFALLFFLSDCQKEVFTTDPSIKLSFSTDTLRFDTVFTELGSATRILKIYNTSNKSLRVQSIYLENGDDSRFNINVDGLPGKAHADVEIAPNDSLYIFAEVTVNPDAPLSSSPFVIDENLVFETNGNVQKVVLEAWGQNAVYLPSRFGAGGVVAFGCDNGEWVWDDPRPYVIYGILVIDECTVRIPAGKQVYIHGGLGREVTDTSTTIYNDGFLAFVGNGRLIVEGTVDEPVIFQSDRLEPEFDEVPGQWTGIWFQSGTSGHQIENCIVRNSIIGMRVDSAVDLSLKNTQIYNTGGSGLIGIHATITAENCLFYGNTGYGIQLEYGGDYTFNYCTVASYGVDGEALRMGNTICYDAACDAYDSYLLRARFNNSILVGGRTDQITLFDRLGDGSLMDYQLTNCIVKVNDLLNPNASPEFADFCNPCLYIDNADTIFIDPNENMFRLDTLASLANGYAVPIAGIDKDLDGKPRDTNNPDAGCYEIEF
jgi:hypothetical protein